MIRLVQLQFTAINGIWGTIAVGLFATDSAPAFARAISDGANQIAGKGLFYGGGFKQFGFQLIRLCSVLQHGRQLPLPLPSLIIKADLWTYVLPKKKKL